MERTRDLRIYSKDSLAQLTKQILSDMGHCLQFSKSEKSAGAFECVNGPEDTSDGFGGI